MKALRVMVIMAAGLLLAAPPALAAWSSCLGCHNGNIAPAKEKLIAKHTTAEAFVKAALGSTNSMMASIKKNEALIRETAKELGLK